MSFFVQPYSPFAGMTLQTCLGQNPASCCLNSAEQKCQVGVNDELKVMRLQYETGAEVIISEEYKLVRSACNMLWLRDRFEVLHALD